MAGQSARVIQGRFGPAGPRVSSFLGTAGGLAAQPRGTGPRPHGGGPQVTPLSGIGTRSGGGRPLPDGVRRKMESYFKADFSDVRVHVGAQAPDIGALAFTLGSDLYFAPGQYNPETPQGQQILGHELTHVIQQRAGRVRNPFGSGIAVVQDPALEAEAERTGFLAATHRAPVQACKAPATAAPPKPPLHAGPGPMARGLVQRKTIMQPGYATGDMFSIAATLMTDRRAHVVIARGPRAGLPGHDPTDKADSIAAFYRESGIEPQRIVLIDVPSVRDGAGKAMKTAAIGIERLLGNTKSNSKMMPSTARQWDESDVWSVTGATKFISGHFDKKGRKSIRRGWNLTESSDDYIRQWLASKGVPDSGRRVAVLWSRFSGKKGDIHLEHDTSYEGMRQIASAAAAYYDAVLIVGDPSAEPGKAGKYDAIVNRINTEQRSVRLFNLTGFWLDQSDMLLRQWDGHTRTGQFRLYDYLHRHFSDARHLGFRSGNLEAMAMMGFTVRYMEEPGSIGGDRMAEWHERNGGRTGLGGMMTGYERLMVEAPPTRSGKYLLEHRDWYGDRPVWAPGRRQIVGKPGAIKGYRKGFSEKDLHSIRTYLQVPDESMAMVPSNSVVSAHDPHVRLAQNMALRLMGLSFGATTAEIDQRYRRIALKVHSDKTQGSDGKMQLLNTARALLKGDFSQTTTMLALTN